MYRLSISKISVNYRLIFSKAENENRYLTNI